MSEHLEEPQRYNGMRSDIFLVCGSSEIEHMNKTKTVRDQSSAFTVCYSNLKTFCLKVYYMPTPTNTCR